MLQDIARGLEGVQADCHTVIAGDPAEAIIKFAREGGFDLIAMSTHGRSGLSEVLQGSVASAVMRSGVAPVLMVRPR
jgi:nucleotide-binding universal stress UspA family protein